MMKTSKWGVLMVTVVFIASLILLVGSAMLSMQRQTEIGCFRYLEEATQQLADDLFKTTDMDRTILTAMASILAGQTDATDARLCDILQSYGSVSSYVSYTELLRPDNTLLDNDGTVRDVSGVLDFSAESAKGAYVSNIEYSSKHPDTRIVRNAVPVVQDGQTIYMLYGVIVLKEFSEAYTTNVYDGNVYVYLVDGDTGDFLLDTWHKDFGNLLDFSDREMRSADTFADAAANMRQGISGNLSFISRSTGDTLYLHYAPVGVNNWYVAVTVQDQYAMAESNMVHGIMVRTAVVAGLLILAYMGFIVALLLSAYRAIRRIGLNDVITALPNRNAYDACLSRNKNITHDGLCCVYVDVNGLHELNNAQGHEAGDRMLRTVADALKSAFPGQEIFRAGGDEFVIIAKNLSELDCLREMGDINCRLGKQGFSIAFGVSTQQHAVGYADTIHQADELMLENKKRYYATHDRRRR